MVVGYGLQKGPFCSHPALPMPTANKLLYRTSSQTDGTLSGLDFPLSGPPKWSTSEAKAAVMHRDLTEALLVSPLWNHISQNNTDWKGSLEIIDLVLHSL